MSDPYVNLEAESAFSFLHGTYRPKALVRAIKAMGQRAVGLTDRWGIYGIYEFLEAAKRESIQPIIGARVMLKDGSWLSLFPLSREGFRNLNMLITLGRAKDAPLPHITMEELGAHAFGLVAICGGVPSVIRDAARKGDEGQVRQWLRRLVDAMGRECVYVSLLRVIGEDPFANRLLRKVSHRLSLKTLVSHPVVYLRREDAWLHRLLIRIQIRHHKRSTSPLLGNTFSPLDYESALMVAPYEDSVRESGRLAERLKGFSPATDLAAIKATLPLYEREGSKERLWERALKRLSRLKKPCPHEYIMRLQREIEVVSQKGLTNIFLLMGEMKEFSESRGITSSIRGSSGGSLLVHLLLGGPDPIRHGLLFERFINQGRMDIPDIDMDFDSERRDEVTQWLLERLPRRSALVATIHTFRPRSAVRLAAKAMGYPLKEIDRLTTCLPWSLRGIPLKEALDRLPELKGSPLAHEEHLVYAGERLEGLPFQASVHLGGVLIAPDDIFYWTPLVPSKKGFWVGHLDKDAVEGLGLLKLDVLGLRMHTAIKKAIQAIGRSHRPLPPSPIPTDDEKTYRLLQSGDTLGVFQLESPGQRNLVLRLLPRRFEDVVVEISLFRPGPVKSDMVRRYLNRRDGIEEVEYPHPDLSEVLKETLGVIVFQEQVIEIVHRFAGFSYDDADAFRRAMTKDRSSGEMARLKDAFIKGAMAQGHPQELCEEVFRRISAFAAYGFCKAHAVAFSEITLKSAYIKAHYPREFYIGLLNAGHVGSYPPWVILNEARRRGISIYPPHVNESHLEYIPEGENGIRPPLTVIHGIGRGIATRIMAERKRHGPFHSIQDLGERVGLSSAILDTLFFAGALPRPHNRKAA